MKTFTRAAAIVTLVASILASLAARADVVATINGQPITEAEVRQASPEEFARLEQEHRKNIRDLIESQLTRIIEDRMIDAEAKARKTDREQLLASIQPADVTDADVDAFYEENRAQITRPKQQVAGQIKTYLAEQRRLEAREQFFKGLKEKYKVDIKLAPLRTEVAATGPSAGPANAPVTIIEFSDFQCPFCSRMIPTLEQVKAKYGDKIRLVFRQFPLDFHPHAQKAAEASLCANEQGKFWELHDAMFQNQQQLAPENLKARAAGLGMNAEQFNACLDSGKFAAQVATDRAQGTAAGVSGTPAIFINGRFINGAVPFEQIAAVIDDELRRQGGSTPSK